MVKSNRIFFLFIPLVLILLMLGATWVVREAERSRSQIPVIKSLQPFQLTDQQGRSFGLEDMEGYVTVIDFIFTRCQGPCPIMSGYMSKLYHRYEQSDKIRFLSISVDPEHDTQEVLQEYAARFQVDDDRWRFLRGNLEEVVKLSEEGLWLPASNLPGGHTTRWALVDQAGNVRGFYRGTDEMSVAALEQALPRLLRNNPVD